MTDDAHERVKQVEAQNDRLLKKIDTLTDKVSELITQLALDSALHRETKKDIEVLSKGIERFGQRTEALERANHLQDIRLTKLEVSASRFNMMDNKATSVVIGIIVAGGFAAYMAIK